MNYSVVGIRETLPAPSPHYEHEHTVYLTIGSNELTVSIDYNVTPGCKPSGPPWSSASDPGWPAECQIGKVEVCIVEPGNPILRRPEKKRWEAAPQWMVDLIANDPDINAEMLECAGVA